MGFRTEWMVELSQRLLTSFRRTFGRAKAGSLYFHFPCFDGIISAVLAADFLEHTGNWNVSQLCPVNYQVRDSWVRTALHKPSAVVDFLYHPDAMFWADHHLTTFVDENDKRNFENRRRSVKLFYDDKAPSCAFLLWNCLSPFLSDRDRYKEMVDWSTKIDSAAYSSVHEALFGDSPAMRISFSLTDRATNEYGILVLSQLRTKTLEEVALLPDVVERYDRVRLMIDRGLHSMSSHIKLLENDVVLFDVNGSNDVIFSRYSPYHFFPQARYSIGILRLHEMVRITAMRNPWRNFDGIQLGKIFERYGGGGHRRVASILLSGARIREADEIRDKLISDIGKAESSLNSVHTERVLA